MWRKIKKSGKLTTFRAYKMVVDVEYIILNIAYIYNREELKGICEWINNDSNILAEINLIALVKEGKNENTSFIRSSYSTIE